MGLDKGPSLTGRNTGVKAVWIAGLFLLGLVPFVALAWWAATATQDRVQAARRSRRAAIGRDPDGADTTPASLARELRLWRRVAPALVAIGVVAGSLLGWQVYRIFATLE